MSKELGLIFCAVTLLSAQAAASTLVRFETTLGDVDVRLFDTATPISVANFLGYVTRGDYDGSFIHRSVPDFIVQGGGFEVTDSIFTTSTTNRLDPILNEPVLTNLRGTLAYAKIPAFDGNGQPIPGGGPDSATNQWFFNVDDNSANLDNQNGGFTVFGAVVGEGLSVVDAINGLSRIDTGLGPFTDVPVTDLDGALAQQDITSNEAVLISRVSVLNLVDGDYNFDGIVDGADYAVWRDQLGASLRISDQPAALIASEADGNGDGVVDLADYQVWLNNFGATSSAQAVAAAVPEPSSLVLVGLLVVSAACRRA